jgi:hypothetical protein
MELSLGGVSYSRPSDFPRLQFRSLNHVYGGPINPQWPVAEPLML